MAFSGSQKFAVLLCKFSDSPNIEPRPADFCRDLFASRGVGGLSDYWADASLGGINLDGTQVFGWKVIDKTRADFLSTYPGRGDKIQGAIAAFPEVNITGFTGTIAVFNVAPGDGGNSGSGVLAQPVDLNVTFLAHETGHAFGLEHSFDQSDRKAVSWSAPGEYYDSYDIMSAMNVDSTSTNRFKPTGPLLNVANLDYMGWLPASRVWKSADVNSTDTYSFDIVSLSHPEIRGFLAANIGQVYVEFRTPEKWDEGLARPAVLLHELSGANTLILASDKNNYVNEWQPGQVFGATDLEMAIQGGTQIRIENFNLDAKTARVSVRRRAVQPYAVGPGHVGLGVAAGGGGVITLPSGRRVPVPPHSPVLNILNKLALIAEAEQTLSQAASDTVARAVYGDLMRNLSGLLQSGESEKL